MKKQKRIMFMLMLVFAVILSMVPLANATETEMETVHEHDYQCEGYDEYFHTMVCATCGDSRTTTHTYTNPCTVCGYKAHEHTWQFTGETYSDKHGMKCTQCDSTTTDDCTFGSNGCCTVCGQQPAHWHEFKWKGNQHSERYHLLECDCGETTAEEHRLVWDGVNRTDSTHGVRCAVCGVTRTHGHWYSNSYENGKVCVECGYGSSSHTWKYNNFSDNEGHELICTDCDKVKFEQHKPNSKDICSVCGYQVYDVNESETEPSKNEQNSSGSKNEAEKPQPTTPADDEDTDHEHNHDEETVVSTQPPTTEPGSGVTEAPSEEEIASEVAVTEEPASEKEETQPVVPDEHDQVQKASAPVLNRTSLMASLAIVALLTLAGILTVVLIKRLKK